MLKNSKAKRSGDLDVQADGQVDAEDEGAAFWQTSVELQETKAVVSKAASGPGGKPLSRAAKDSGVSLNAEGDLAAFVTGLVTTSCICIACVCFFMFASKRYPLTFQNNLRINSSPLDSIPECRFGWLKASWRVTTEQAIDNCGLDQAMLLTFMGLGMKIMAILGIPLLCILGPVHAIFGGHAAGSDHLSYLSFGNVENGSNLYWIHAFVVWAVVFTVQSCVYTAQKNFLPLRFRWLRELPNPRANTILVEGIPLAYQSDKTLKDFFEQMFGGSGKVLSTYVVRIAPELEARWNSREAKREAFQKARFKAQRADSGAADKEAAVALQDELAELEKEVMEEQLRVKSKSCLNGPDGFHASAGFVSFKDKSDAALALSMKLGVEADEWEVSLPPEPCSVLYSDLQQSATSTQSFMVIGYLLTAGLYMLYIPAVIGITQIAVSIHLGPLQPIWQAFAPTVGLSFMLSFLPTFLILIFRFCFTLKDETWAQHMLQNWYFVFQVVFVILITAIGGSATELLRTLVDNPWGIVDLLGNTLPFATHFYMNFLVLQWAAHALNLCRATQLAKWILFRSMYDDETARVMAEPEDQDYYGIGSRSSRMTINLCIGIIFSTLCPPIALLAFIDFLICRIVYGYLIPFAESRKPDLGGVFWAHQLMHVFLGSFIYCIVMTGVLLGRATTSGPGIIAACSMPYVIWSMRKFETAFAWEKLPFKELVEPAVCKPKADVGEYVQSFMK